MLYLIPFFRREVWSNDGCQSYERGKQIHQLFLRGRVHGKIQGPVTFTIDSRKFEYTNSSTKNSKDSSRIDLAQQPSNN